MSEIDPNDIVVPPYRARRAFDERALSTLAASIQSKGLLHPIVLRNDGRTLIAGERRLRAVKTLGWASVPVRLARDLSTSELIEAEIEENTVRQDLSWQEQAEATAKLHALRNQQTGGRQTLGATATEIHGTAANTTAIHDQIILAEHLGDPDVAKAETRKEALSILRKKMEKKLAAAYGESLEGKGSPHRLLVGDCERELLSLPTGLVDVICTDPPYGIGADTAFSTATQISHTYADSPAVLDRILRNVVPRLTLVAKPDAHAYIFTHISNFHLWATCLTELGWSVWPTPLIWHHPNFGTCPNPHFGFRRGYDAVVAARRVPGRPLLRANEGDVISINQESNLLHAARKPVELYTNLLQRSARPGDTVLDPFCGSGPIFPAATKLHLKAIGIEMDEEMAKIARGSM